MEQLELPFSEEEVKQVISSMPKEKAPVQMAILASSFISCWIIVKEDIMRPVNHFYSMNQKGQLTQPSLGGANTKKEQHTTSRRFQTNIIFTN